MTDFDAELWFHRRASFYVESQVLFHLNQCGVFAAMADGRCFSSAELAMELQLERGPLQACLEYISSMDSILSESEEGGFVLTESGQKVLERFGRSTPTGPAINLFDVRVGGYGPVWSALGALIRGEKTYGAEVSRAGELAAEGVYKIGERMAPGLARVLEELPVGVEVELGVTTGLLERMSQRGPARMRVGMDRSQEALLQADKRARLSSQTDLNWIQGDFFESLESLGTLKPRQDVVFFSVHFHEFLAQGRAAVVAWLKSLRGAFPGAWVVALEHPAMDGQAGTEVLRLYSASNRFIHHLIGNGHILSPREWTALFEESGAQVRAVQDLGYLGYQAWVVELLEEA